MHNEGNPRSLHWFWAGLRLVNSVLLKKEQTVVEYLPLLCEGPHQQHARPAGGGPNP